MAKALSTRCGRTRVYVLSDSSPRVSASWPPFLFEIEPDFRLLSQTSERSSQKIDSVFPASLELISGASRALAPSPIRVSEIPHKKGPTEVLTAYTMGTHYFHEYYNCRSRGFLWLHIR
jgi:hypothetical protein